METPPQLAKLARSVEAADLALGQKVAQRQDQPIAEGADKVGKLGDQEPLYVVAALMIVGGLASSDRRLAGAGVATLIAVGAADAGKTLTKHHISRTRPHVLIEEGRYEAKIGGSEEKEKQSFPSGHVAGCVAAARAVARNYPEAKPHLGAAVLVMGIARVVKGAHWPLDVLAGAVIGWLAEAVTSRILRAIGLPISH